MPVEHDSRIEKVGVVKGYSYPRNLLYQADRRELFVGDGNGIITCLDINKFEAGPIGNFMGLKQDSVKAHKGEIIWLGHDGEGRIVSTGKDEKMMVISLWSKIVLGGAREQEDAEEAFKAKEYPKIENF